MAGKKITSDVKWLDNSNWSTWLKKSGNFLSGRWQPCYRWSVLFAVSSVAGGGWQWAWCSVCRCRGNQTPAAASTDMTMMSFTGFVAIKP